MSRAKKQEEQEKQEKPEPTFEQAMAELEQVVGQLESGQASLQESLRLFARGVELVRICQRQLDAASQQVQQLLTQEDGTVTAVPFDPASAGGNAPS
ncbi:MAG: exodeoxyribonuclease VII small subunit [Limnochordaceae bacterium]|nr:exodeoxyribonuclease VII small subunit [Limnochordaceae bacterium]